MQDNSEVEQTHSEWPINVSWLRDEVMESVCNLYDSAHQMKEKEVWAGSSRIGNFLHMCVYLCIDVREAVKFS